jgi:microcin C transport system substrate-binding protein
MSYFNWVACFALVLSLVAEKSLGEVSPATAVSSPATAVSSPATEAPSPAVVVQPTHGISMYGELKYPADFKHFDTNNPNAKQGGTLRLHAIGHVFDTLNPWLLKGIPAAGLAVYSYLPFDTLGERSPDEPFSVYGRLAASFEMPEDRSFITINLRPEARFQDGSPVTASDVLFTYTMLKDYGSPTRKQLAKKIKAILILNPQCIQFIFEKIEETYDREMPLLIALMPVISEKHLQGKSFDQTGLTPLMGSGPYKIETVIPGKRIVYRKDSAYWGKDLPCVKGVYNFDQISFDYYGSEFVAFEAFKSGLIDVWKEMDLTRWMTGYHFPAVLKGDIVREEADHSHAVGMTALVFNMRPERGIFKDARVREAITLLFDFDWINKNLFYNGYTRTESFFQNTFFQAKDPLSPEEKAILENLKGLNPLVLGPLPVVIQSPGQNKRDTLHKAGQLLERAGWVLKDGMLRNVKTGAPFRFEILISDPKREKVVGIFAGILRKKLGIQVDVRAVDNAHYQKRLQDYAFDMIVHFWGHTLSPGVEQQLYWSSRLANVPSRNYAGVRSKAVDEICKRIAEAHTYQELTTLIRVLDRLLRHERLCIPLYHHTKDIVAYRKHLKHPPFLPTGIPELYSWWPASEK